MRLPTRPRLLFFGGLLVLPLWAADEKKDDKKDVDKKGPELIKAGTLVGKVVAIDESKRSIKLHIEVPELNQGEYNGLLQAQVDLARAAADPNPQSRLQKIQAAQNKMAQHQARLYTSKGHDVDLNTAEDVKVRLKNPPTKFDDKGKIVRYTEKELKELKGDDPKQPGYNGEFTDVRPGTIIEARLVKKKGTPMIPKPMPGPKGKDVDPVDIKALWAEYTPLATLIIVLAEPPPG